MANKKPRNNNRPDRGKNRRAGNAPKMTAEEKRQRLAKELRLKPKTRQFIDKLIEEPKLSQTEAYIQTHETNNRNTAKVEASKLLTKPNVQIYKASAVGKAKRRVVELVGSNNESIALKASQDILDRTEGKAVQRHETENRSVEVKLDLSGVRIGSHYIKPNDTPAIDQ